MSEDRLVSRFITENLSEGLYHGCMQATVLLADMKGFTRLTDEAMRSGEGGAEWISGVLSSAFTPFVDFVEREKGFVAEFEGDAAMAVFSGERPELLEKAVRLFEDISVNTNKKISFAARASSGKLYWGIGGSEGILFQLFHGRCVSDVFGYSETLPDVAKWNRGQETASAFFPGILKGRKFTGEFRTAFSAFLSLQVSSVQEAGLFFESVCKLVSEMNGFLNGTHLRGKKASALVVFGAPVALEGDARYCGEFVLELRKQFPSLSAGVSAGTAYAGFVGSGKRCSYTVLGSRVNLASRLCDAAEAGEILVDDGYRRLVKPYFAAGTGELFQLKGFSEPCRSYRLQGQTAETVLFPEQGVFVGREREIEQIAEGFKYCGKHSRLTLVNVLGEPGIGKSRLLRQVVSRHRPGVTALVITGDEFMGKRSLHLWLEAFRGMPKDELKHLAESPGNIELRNELVWAQEYLETLVNAPDELSSSHENTVYAISVLLNSAAKSGKFILGVEDPDQMDQDSLDILQSFVMMNEDSKSLVIVTGRQPESIPGFLVGTIVVRLGPFSIQETVTKLSMDTGFSVRDNVAELLHIKSAGNPLYLEELSSMIQQDQMKGTWSTWQDMGHLLPVSLGSLLESRIDHLPEEIKEAVAVASVLGSEFETEVLRQMLSIDSAAISQGLSLGIWKPRGGGKLSFRHHLLRETSYRMLLVSRRKQIHRLASDVIWKLHPDPAGEHLIRIAMHAAKADYTDLVLKYLEPAGDHCRQTHQNELAIELYSELESFAENPDTAMRARGKKAAVLEVVGRWEEAFEIYRTSVKLADTGDDLLQHSGRMRISLGRLYMLKGEYDKAVLVLKEAESILSGFHETVLAAVYANLGGSFMRMGEYGESGVFLHRWYDIAVRSGDKRSIAMAAGTLAALAQEMGETGKVIEYCRLEAELAEQSGEEILVGVSFFNLANLAAANGEVDLAQSYFEKDLKINRGLGDRLGECIAMGALCDILCYKNQLEKAAEYAGYFLKVSRILGNRHRELSALLNVFTVQLYSGDFGEAGDTLETRLSVAEKSGFRDVVLETRFFTAVAEIVKDDLNKALTIMESTLEYAVQNGVEVEPLYSAVAGILYTLTGSPEEGERCLAETGGTFSSDASLLSRLVTAVETIVKIGPVHLALTTVRMHLADV